MNASQRSSFSQRRSHSKWMFDISPVCQANLALWHAITGLITAVCGLEGTQAVLAALTGPDRLIRSAGTQNGNSQTPHISSLAHKRFCKCKKHCSLHLFSDTFLLFSSPHFKRSHLLSPLFHFLAGVFGFCDISTKNRCCQPFTISAQHLFFQFSTPTLLFWPEKSRRQSSLVCSCFSLRKIKVKKKNWIHE